MHGRWPKLSGSRRLQPPRRPCRYHEGSDAASFEARRPRRDGRRLSRPRRRASRGAERAHCIVKTVRRDHIHDGSFLARFLDEARVQAAIAASGGRAGAIEGGDSTRRRALHRGRVRRGRCALMRGPPARDCSRASAISRGPDAVAIAIEIAQALSHVHGRSGAGRVLAAPADRPPPVPVAAERRWSGTAVARVKLIDFGTARSQNRQAATRWRGVVLRQAGLRRSPQVARQQVGDGRIDLYALGVDSLGAVHRAGALVDDGPAAPPSSASAERGRVVVPGRWPALCGAPRRRRRGHRLPHEERPGRAVSPRAAIAVARPGKPPHPGARAEGLAERGRSGSAASASALMRALWPHEPGRAREPSSCVCSASAPATTLEASSMGPLARRAPVR